jgi:hypothetical protein
MPQLFAPGCSILLTKRRRFLWAAWWTGAPAHIPFRQPDASEGGAASHEEAFAEAQRRAGCPLILLDPLWARAWNRILRGEDPWPSAASREPRPRAEAPRVSAEEEASVWAVLGVKPGVTPAELKAAYRRRVLEHHPDQGGNAEALRRVLAAYDEALRRLRLPARKPRNEAG